MKDPTEPRAGVTTTTTTTRGPKMRITAMTFPPPMKRMISSDG
jgi:hypothetical protein